MALSAELSQEFPTAAVSVALVEPPASVEVWTIIVQARVAGEWMRVGDPIVTDPVRQPLTGPRIVAVSSIPGAEAWRAEATGGTESGRKLLLLVAPTNPAIPIGTWNLDDPTANLIPGPPGPPGPAGTGGDVLIWQPDGGGAGGTYDDWASLYAAITAKVGPVRVVVDTSIANPAVVSAASGVSSLGGRVTFSPLIPAAPSSPSRSVIRVEDGAQLENLGGLIGLTLTTTQTTAPALIWTGTQPLLLLADQALIVPDALASQPVNSVGPGQTLDLLLEDSYHGDFGANPTTQVDATGTLNIWASGLSDIAQNSLVALAPTSQAMIVCDTGAAYASTQTGFVGAVLNFSRVGFYEPSTPANWPPSPPTTIKQALDRLAGGAGVAGLTRLLFVDGERGNDATATGAISLPFKTIQAAIDTIPPSIDSTTVRYNWGILITPMAYDEDLTIDLTNQKIALLGFGGPFGLGTFGGAAGVPSGTPRNVVANVNASNIDSFRHTLSIGVVLGQPIGISTHAMNATTPKISGKLLLNDNVIGGTTKELQLNAVFYDAGATGNCVEVAGVGVTGVTYLWAQGARFVTGILGTNMRLAVARQCNFEGLININQFFRFEDCSINAGMTLASAAAVISPSGMVNCNFAGTLTGPVGCGRMDGNTNYWFKTNGAALGGLATKVIQDDLVP